MAAASLVMILVAAGQSATPETTGMVSALHEARGGDAEFVVQEEAAFPADADAQLLAEKLGAEAIAEISWTDPKLRRVEIRLFARKRASWFTRSISFASADADLERGRTLGFTVSAMLPETPSPFEPAPAEARPVVDAPPAPAPKSATTTLDPPARFALFAALESSAATGGEGALGGGTGGFALRAIDGLWFRAAIGGRTGGAVPGARLLVLSSTLGVEARLARSLLGATWFVRGELVVARTSLLGASGTAPAGLERERWMPGASSSLEARWRVQGSTWFFADLGLEAFPTATRVVERGTTIATLPPVRALGQLGLRFAF